MAKEEEFGNLLWKKYTPKCSLLLVKGPPLSGWLPGEARLVRGGPSQKARAALQGGGLAAASWLLD